MSVAINRDETLILPDFRIEVLASREAIKREVEKETPPAPEVEEDDNDFLPESLIEIKHEGEQETHHKSGQEAEPERRRTRRRQHYTQRRSRHRDERRGSIVDQIIEDISPSQGIAEGANDQTFPVSAQETSEPSERREHRNRRRGRRGGHQPRSDRSYEGSVNNESGGGQQENSIPVTKADSTPPALGGKVEPTPQDSFSEDSKSQKTQKKKGWWKRLLES